MIEYRFNLNHLTILIYVSNASVSNVYVSNKLCFRLACNLCMSPVLFRAQIASQWAPERSYSAWIANRVQIQKRKKITHHPNQLCVLTKRSTARFPPPTTSRKRTMMSWQTVCKSSASDGVLILLVMRRRARGASRNRTWVRIQERGTGRAIWRVRQLGSRWGTVKRLTLRPFAQDVSLCRLLPDPHNGCAKLCRYVIIFIFIIWHFGGLWF